MSLGVAAGSNVLGRGEDDRRLEGSREFVDSADFSNEAVYIQLSA